MRVINKIDELKRLKSSLIEEMGNIEIKLYSIDREIDKIEKHNIASAKWFNNLSDDKKKIRNLKHLLRYYENKIKDSE